MFIHYVAGREKTVSKRPITNRTDDLDATLISRCTRIRVFVQAVRKPFMHLPTKGGRAPKGARTGRALRARPRPHRGPLAFRRSTAALARSPQATGSAPGHASWDVAKRVDHKTTTRQFVKLTGVTRLHLSQSSDAPRAPVVVPACVMPGAARERFARPSAGTAPAPPFGSHPECARR